WEPFPHFLAVGMARRKCSCIRISYLEKRLANVIKSSKAERQILIEILASLGILKPNTVDRQRQGKNDWVFAEYWRGEDKYCQQTVDRLFGEYLTG
ncbi:hypothetical protein ODY78_18565, partial [Shewanella xiamenensis]|nr:hypothetical protein [Shewanella xiamenensis]